MNPNVLHMNTNKGKQAYQIYITNAFVQDVCFYYASHLSLKHLSVLPEIQIN